MLLMKTLVPAWRYKPIKKETREIVLPSVSLSDQYQHTNYLKPVVRTKNLRKSVANAVRALQRHAFDSIAFRGMSGALIAPSVALAMKKELIMVRKPEDTSHSEYKVEGFKGCKRYVIVDDFICTGRTCNTIVEAVKKFAPEAAVVGALTLSSCSEESSFTRLRGTAFPLYVQEECIGQKSSVGEKLMYWKRREFTDHKIPRVKVPKQEAE